MATKTSVDPSGRAIVYAESGNDTWSGLSNELPKETMPAAITVASLLIPTPDFDNPAIVSPSQPGNYSTPIALIEGLIFNSIGIVFDTDTPTSIEMADHSGATTAVVRNSQDNSTIFSADGVKLASMNSTLLINSGENGILWDVKNACSDIFTDCIIGQVAGEGGIGLNFTGTSPVPTAMSGQRLDLIGDNSTAVIWNPSGPSAGGICNLGSIFSVAVSNATGILQAGSDTTAFDVRSQKYSAMVPEIVATELCSLVSGAELTVISPSIDANITVPVGATLNIICPNHTGAVANNGTTNGIIGGKRYGNWLEALLNLTDTPSDYSGQAGKALVVNDAEDAVEFRPVVLLPVTFVKNGNLSAGSFMVIGEVTTSAVIGYILPKDLTLEIVTICRTDTDAADIEILCNGVVKATVPTAALKVVDSSISVACLEGDVISARNKAGSNTISNAIVSLIFEGII